MQKFQNLDPKHKKILIIGAIIVILGLGYSIFRSPAKKMVTTKSSILPENTEIQLVDDSVKVSFSSQNKKEASVKVESIPKDTELIEYEISYNTAEEVPQGAIGKLDINGNTASKDQLTFGTCSSGTCRYHNLVGTVKLLLKFSGSYGERLFEKEFSN